jgi:HisA/HisF family protein
MDIIPVIDLKNGVVVRARSGRRDQYRPIQTPLSRTSDPVDVARGLMSVHPFTTLYVADLDAITATGDNRAVLMRLKAEYPRVAMWVDNGIAGHDAAERWLASGVGCLVLGSETQADDALVRRLREEPRVVLSLDFRGDAFQGPPALLADNGAWPRDVIVMTLARVGSGEGPDMGRLAAIRAAASERRIYAAGGVRDAADLAALKKAGIAGALVASCLHDGLLTGQDIARL